MRKVLKWISRIVGSIVLLVVVAVAAIYAISEYKLRCTYDVAVSAIPIPTGAVSIAAGKRLAELHGCYGACHGKQAEGRVIISNWLAGTIITPDLTCAVHELTTRELVRVIRHGVLPNGRSVSKMMPSAAFYNLTDADLGKIIAFLRSLPPSHGQSSKVTYGPGMRLGVVLGTFVPSAAEIDHDAARLDPGDGSDPVALGRYLAKTTCSACHGQNLASGFAPDLKIVTKYSPEEFTTLMRTLVTRDGRQPPPGMKGFKFTDHEIDALYVYLREALPKELAAAAKADADG